MTPADLAAKGLRVKPMTWQDFGHVSAAATEEGHYDNLAVALCSYFDGHMDCPEDGDKGSELDDYDCWKVWVSENAERVLRRIAAMIEQEGRGDGLA
jgi:hypothetical protein